MSMRAQDLHFYKPDLETLISVAGFLCLAGVMFRDALAHMVGGWLGMEEYSHGILIPFISAYLVWQRRFDIASIPLSGSWLGVFIFAFGLVFYNIGELATLYIVMQYAVLIAIFGFSLAVFGFRIFRLIWIPLFFLFFAIRLPNFLYQGLSSKLQLWSSTLGVSFIRFCDITVFQEGNVIDLGTMQLQVVEACSGLRYLFPLMSLAFICAYFYKVEIWKKAVIFLSSIPVTILMNSFRIGVIGVTVEYFGKDAAEGFLHDFEGWIVFMACTAFLIFEMWFLARLGKDPRPLHEVFGLTFPEPFPTGAQFLDWRLPTQFWVVGVLLLFALGLSASLVHRAEIVPGRSEYIAFPLKIGDWVGRRVTMEQQYIDALKFDDYILADFVRQRDTTTGRSSSDVVNFYSAYYSSQRKGESIHSPRSCIPGGGWQIVSNEPVAVDGLLLYGRSIRFNRLVIQRGEDRQLVYYWFQQRGRDLTNEYVVKWYLFLDALAMNRTDGALVRLTTLAPKGEDIAAADARLQDFLKVSLPELDKYIPR